MEDILSQYEADYFGTSLTFDENWKIVKKMREKRMKDFLFINYLFKTSLRSAPPRSHVLKA